MTLLDFRLAGGASKSRGDWRWGPTTCQRAGSAGPTWTGEDESQQLHRATEANLEVPGRSVACVYPRLVCGVIRTDL
jgi:hypothetical protein